MTSRANVLANAWPIEGGTITVSVVTDKALTAEQIIALRPVMEAAEAFAGAAGDGRE